MTKASFAVTLVAFAALALAGSIGAQSTQPMQGSMNARSSQKADSAFAQDAASGGIAEVELGQLAEQKGSTDAVRKFGKQMEGDHSDANNKLKQIASQDNIAIPAKMNSQDQAAYDRLSKLSGAGFDKAYAQLMVQDHQKDIAAFQQEASNGENPDLKNFASKTLPTLREHLRMAQGIQGTLAGQ